MQFLGNQKARDLLLLHSENHILFGSDSPWGSQFADIDAIRNLRLGPDRTRKLLGGNAAMLLGL